MLYGHSTQAIIATLPLLFHVLCISVMGSERSSNRSTGNNSLGWVQSSKIEYLCRKLLPAP